MPTLSTYRRLVPFHVRFPVRHARSYKFTPGLTEACKEFKRNLYIGSRVPALIPTALAERMAQKYWSDWRVLPCSVCASRMVGYLDSVCSVCLPTSLWTADGRWVQRGEEYRAYPGATPWSSRSAYLSGSDDDSDDESYDDDSYDDDSYDEHQIADYHSHPRRSRVMRLHEPMATDPWAHDVIHLGFEWEYNTYSERARKKQADDLDETGFCVAETDGSLDSERGLEVVTGWSTLGTVSEWARLIGRTIEVEDLKDAGLHVTVSGLTILQTAKFCTFMSRNSDLTTAIGGRRASSYASQQSGVLVDWLRKTKDYRGQLGSCRPSTDKYTYCNVRTGGPIEVRIFNSTASSKEVVYRLEYAWLVAQLCRQPGMDLSERGLKAFLQESPWAVRGCRTLLDAFPRLCPTKFVKRKLKATA